MGLDFDQVLYARAGWRKRLLIPLWTFQIAVLLCLMGLFAYRLAETFDHYSEEKRRGRPPTVELVWEASNVACNLVALVLNMIEVARLATERLTPFLMVCSHVIKLTLGLAVLALDCAAYIQGIDGDYPTIGLSLDVGLLAAVLIGFGYSIYVYRKNLKFEEYQLASARAHGGVELGHRASTASTKPIITASTTTRLSYSDYYDPGPEYTVPYPPYNVYRDNYRSYESQTKRLSTPHIIPPTSPPQQQQQQPSSTTLITPSLTSSMPPPPTTVVIPPSPSEKLAPSPIINPTNPNPDDPEAISPADLRKQIDRALDAEFWGGGDSSEPPSTTNNPTTTTTDATQPQGEHGPGLDRSKSVVLGGGNVAMRTNVIPNPATPPPEVVAAASSVPGKGVVEVVDQVTRKASWKTEIVDGEEELLGGDDARKKP